jgi:hypothetical protein
MNSSTFPPPAQMPHFGFVGNNCYPQVFMVNQGMWVFNRAVQWETMLWSQLIYQIETGREI